MKNKMMALWIGVIGISLVFTGCGSAKNSENSKTYTVGSGVEQTGTETSEVQIGSQEKDTDTTERAAVSPVTGETISLKIVDGAKDGNLILAGAGTNDVYSLSVDEIPVYLDGEMADAAVLEDGMIADISYNGTVMETFPAMLGEVDGIYVYSRGSRQNPGGSLYDLSGLYLKVLEDLWEEDPGMNDGSEYISVDLSEAPGNLTEGEKTAIAWIFAREHDGQMLTLSYRELVDQGYVQNYTWENGILFLISSNSGVTEYYSLPVVKFNAEKWRSGTGAYYFEDCQAIWSEMGTWEDYSVGEYAIS